eukprot:3096347-Prymnesium_polylepis.1
MRFAGRAVPLSRQFGRAAHDDAQRRPLGRGRKGRPHPAEYGHRGRAAQADGGRAGLPGARLARADRRGLVCELGRASLFLCGSEHQQQLVAIFVAVAGWGFADEHA